MTPEPDERSPAIRQLEEYLESLRDEQPEAGPDLVPHIVRRARWQRAVRVPLRAFGSLVGALADGLTVLIGSGEGPKR